MVSYGFPDRFQKAVFNSETDHRCASCTADAMPKNRELTKPKPANG
jgi:hypothetical protein